MAIRLGVAATMVTETLLPVDEQETGRANLRTRLKRLWPVSGAVQEISCLDGLRALAVFMTLFPHLLWATIDSPKTNPALRQNLTDSRFLWDIGISVSGVVLFFVLSGFLLFRPYARAMFGLQKYPSARKFYIRRILRIMPAYLVSLVLLVVLLEPEYLSVSHWPDLGLHVFMLQNWSFETRNSINPPFWTMAVESQFYLVLPLMAYGLFALNRMKRRWLVGGFLLLAALSPLYRLLWAVVKHAMPQLFEHITILELLGYLCAFVMGMACSLFYVAINETTHLGFAQEKIQFWCRVAGVSGVIFFGVWLFAISNWHLLEQAREPIVALCFGGILLGTLIGWPSWNRFFSRPALRFIGVISYSLYIWNLPLYEHFIVPFTQIFDTDVTAMLLGLLLIPVVIIPFAFASYHFVEKPFLQARRKQH